MPVNRYTYKQKAEYHAKQSRPGAVSANGNPLSDFARGRHSALAQINYTNNVRYAHKKEAEAMAKRYGYPDLAAFNASPEGKALQHDVRMRNQQYRELRNSKYLSAVQKIKGARLD